MSFGPLILGHRNPKVELAVKEALTRGWSFGACEKYSLELAQYLVDRIEHVDQIRFVNSGTEAVMTAIRLVRGYTGKNKIIKFNGCYHGHIDAMLIKAGSGLAGTAEASSQGVTHHVAEDTLVCNLGDLESIKSIFSSHKDQIAGVFIEPLPANNGLLPQAKHFLQEIRDLCTKNNALLVFDEVISGFRVGFQGMAKELEITPDVVTYGKIIGGGFPVGAIAGKKEIMQCLAPVGPVYQAGTLSANPVAMVAGLVNLQQLTDEFYSDLENYSNSVVQLLSNWLEKNNFQDYSIRQYKSLFWLVPTQNEIQSIDQIPNNLTERFYQLFQVLLDKGIYLSPNAYEVGFVSISHDSFVQEELKKRLWN